MTTFKIGERVRVEGYDGPGSDCWNGRSGEVYDLDRAHVYVEFNDQARLEQGGFLREFIVPDKTSSDAVMENLKDAVKAARQHGYTVSISVEL